MVRTIPRNRYIVKIRLFYRILFLCMTVMHLWANYKAVTVLCFETFNQERLHITLQHYWRTRVVFSPTKVNEEESPFWLWNNPSKKSVTLGASFTSVQHEDFQMVKKSLQTQNYFISTRNNQNVYVILTSQCTPSQIFRAYCEALSQDQFDFDDFATKAQEQGWKTTHLQMDCLGWRGELT